MERRIDQIVTELEQHHKDPDSQKPISESTLHALQKVIDYTIEELSSKILSISLSIIPSLTSAMESGGPQHSLLASKVYLSFLLTPNSNVISLFTPHGLLRTIRYAFKNRPSGRPSAFVVHKMAMDSDEIRKSLLNFSKYLVCKAPERAELRALAVESILEIVKALEHKDQIDFVDYVVNMTRGKPQIRLLGMKLTINVSIRLCVKSVDYVLLKSQEYTTSILGFMDTDLHLCRFASVMESSHKSNLPVADKSCPVSSTPVEKLQIHESQCLDAHFESPALEKTEETLNSQVNKDSAELPEKFKSLLEHFDHMITSIRVLNLHKKLPSFHNICLHQEGLTGRKFSYKDLAQIKFILPEAVQIEKVLVPNKQTSCMEPHLKVAFNFDSLEGHTDEHSDYIALSHVFSSKLFKLVNEHSEDFDVPEAELPGPFNRREMTVSFPAMPVDSSNKTLPNINEAELLNPSYFPRSFKKRFSTKDVDD
ncbi:CDT1-like protein a, chloroplastic isoform X1 [Tanacetum coccineum]